MYYKFSQIHFTEKSSYGNHEFETACHMILLLLYQSRVGPGITSCGECSRRRIYFGPWL